MRSILIAATVAAGLVAAPAAAQQNGLVNVDVSNVLNNLSIANGSLNNNTVQVPIGVAAAVCGINANVIAKQRQTNPNYSCPATTTNQALKQAAQRQATPAH
jgi:hypothetical protein